MGHAFSSPSPAFTCSILTKQVKRYFRNTLWHPSSASCNRMAANSRKASVPPFGLSRKAACAISTAWLQGASERKLKGEVQVFAQGGLTQAMQNQQSLMLMICTCEACSFDHVSFQLPESHPQFSRSRTPQDMLQSGLAYPFKLIRPTSSYISVERAGGIIPVQGPFPTTTLWTKCLLKVLLP